MRARRGHSIEGGARGRRSGGKEALRCVWARTLFLGTLVVRPRASGRERRERRRWCQLPTGSKRTSKRASGRGEARRGEKP
ncbi:hypothetical protein Mp_1g19890 [Marchantia polymorpha subsp. ruderalis]|uniref:Uncharacterized protein n=2 Tax=Marchantia polymorpha TaxID=3197 RepID=A0AAF6AS28_MARPO|nr:hypothetical protein MARPO_0001s0326 [Marchantia polymorpha]BBM99248.1 hypothetical protein Mp_1g19890 [Marchantia polymorpha subsp. ruderalis]|eukprot:PTQ50330.1 hypothetical protein MARPO_0001s0326 [Marchantia polymorpha]